VSLGEIVLLLLVGIIVVGPRNLPSMMRTAGQWVARLKRMTTDLRSQSGIDDILRTEGLDEHLHQLRSLSRLNVVDTLMAPAASSAASAPYAPPPTSATMNAPGAPAPTRGWQRQEPFREREYPLIGCDASGTLPDDAVTYRMMALNAPKRLPAEATADEAKADEAGEAKADDGKADDAKADDAKADDAKADGAKPDDAKADGAKPDDPAQATTDAPAEAQPAATEANTKAPTTTEGAAS
jgi:sec-independent protein translocase protein TatB